MTRWLNASNAGSPDRRGETPQENLYVTETIEPMTPKAFISYSWTSHGHQALVQQWAEQLVADGIDVVLDVYDLKEGHDKFAFMERMVTDPSVTHVLVICDKLYAEKADARKAGVGTESQIISKEVYEKADQAKFIPIVTELSETGDPFLPTFLKSRIWLDFSSPEATNEHWEGLVRLLHGKPLHQKPQLGKPPAYISEDSASPASPAISKYNALRQAILQGKKGLSVYRRDFLDSCIDYADALRVRERPDLDSLGAKILEDCGKLKHVRNHIVDWVLLESAASPSDDFCQALLDVLERLRELKSRPPEVNSWNDSWFEAHSVFVYETFLYIIAALLKTSSFGVLREVFTSQYLLPRTERRGDTRFESFVAFWGSSETLQSVLAPEGRRLYSPAAELIKRQADRDDVPFRAVMEAELLALLMAFLTPGGWWYPQTLHYAPYGPDFPFFLRATQHKHFEKLAMITGIGDAEEMRQAAKEGNKRIVEERWLNSRFEQSLWSLMNMDKLDTIK